MKKPEVTWWDQLWFILLFVSGNSILIILIYCIFLNIDRLKKNSQYILNMSEFQNNRRKRNIIASQNKIFSTSVFLYLKN